MPWLGYQDKGLGCQRAAGTSQDSTLRVAGGQSPAVVSLIDGLEWKRTFLVPEANPYFLISENMKIMPNGL